jgi:hypothetical protein
MVVATMPPAADLKRNPSSCARQRHVAPERTVRARHIDHHLVAFRDPFDGIDFDHRQSRSSRRCDRKRAPRWCHTTAPTPACRSAAGADSRPGAGSELSPATKDVPRRDFGGEFGSTPVMAH